MTRRWWLALAGVTALAGVGGLVMATDESCVAPPPTSIAYGTNGSVVIAADGTPEMVGLYREARALGCEGFGDPTR